MASPQVEVKNLDSAPYEEVWNNRKITIPAGGTVKMSHRDATTFLGRYGGNHPDGRMKIKNLEIITPLENVASGQEMFTCNRCGVSFETQAELAEHSKIHESEVFKDERLEKTAEKKEENKIDGLPCPLCSLSFKSLHGLQIHLAAHAKKEKVKNDTSASVSGLPK